MNSKEPTQISFALAEYEGKKKITRREVSKASVESNLAGLRRYRVADWRVIALIEDKAITITVVKPGHRSKVYD